MTIGGWKDWLKPFLAGTSAGQSAVGVGAALTGDETLPSEKTDNSTPSPLINFWQKFTEQAAAPAIQQYCFTNFGPLESNKDDETDWGQQWTDVVQKFKTSIAEQSSDSSLLLYQLVITGYKLHNIDKMGTDIIEAAKALEVAKSRTKEATDAVIAADSADEYSQASDYQIEELSDAINDERAKELAYSSAVEKKSSYLYALYGDVISILNEVNGVSSAKGDDYARFNAPTYAVVAAAFANSGEPQLAKRFYEAASAKATDMGTKLKFKLLAYGEMNQEEIEAHRDEIEHILTVQLPALMAMSRVIEDAKVKEAAAVARAETDVAQFLTKLKEAQEAGDQAMAMQAELDLQRTNPQAYITVMTAIYGEAATKALRDQLDENSYGIHFSSQAWKTAGYDMSSGSPYPSLLPGDTGQLAQVQVEAWKLFYRASQPRTQKRRWAAEDLFDKILAARLKETDGKLPPEEAMMFAGAFGDMLIRATTRYGDLETLLKDGNDPGPRYQKLLDRFQQVKTALTPHVEKSTGNTFFEMEASLAMRLNYDGAMATHDYLSAFDTSLPSVIQEYGASSNVQSRLASLKQLYPNHFSGDCVVTGLDFSDSEQALDAVAREKAMFKSADSITDTLIDAGGGFVGGALGCVLVGGVTAFFTKSPKATVWACRGGAFVAGAIAAGETEIWNQERHLEEHAAQVESARKAGISLVAQDEARMYESQSHRAVVFAAGFGALAGLSGGSVVRFVGGRFLPGLFGTAGALATAGETGAAMVTDATVDAGVTGAAGVSSAEAVAGTASRASILSRLVHLPNGTKAMIVGGSLVSLDYFAIDNIAFERQYNPDGTRDMLPSLSVEWGADYHVDTPVGIAGSLLLAGGMGKRLIESPEFRTKFYNFMIGGEPHPGVDPALYQNSFWKRMAVNYGLLSQKGEQLALKSYFAPVAFPFNATVGPLERISAPLFFGDLATQQFLIDEEWMEANGIQKTPRLSIVGGIALSLWGGNRIPIRVFKLPADGQRIYFVADRFLDIYMMSGSGNANFWDADWARIALKYISGWSVGQIRGNMLRYALVKGYNQRFLKAVALEGAGLKSLAANFHSLPEAEKNLFAKLLKYTDSMDCTVRLDQAGNILRGDKIIGTLSNAERDLMLTLLTKGKGGVPTFSGLFKKGQTFIDFSVAPKLNARGLAAFSLLHDTVIGTSYDYIRGEYIIFGDGNGYAMWTLLRSVSILPAMTALKVNLGWSGNLAVASDLPNRFIISPLWTNWTRIYAKAGLWWPSFGPMLDNVQATDQGTQGLLGFLTGTDTFTANGLDNWSTAHWPVNCVTDPSMNCLTIGNSDTKPAYDTFSDAYEQLTAKLIDGKLDKERMEVLDELTADMISEVQAEMQAGGKGADLQTKIEHAEVLASVAYAVHYNNPTTFNVTMGKHSEWINKVLGPQKPVTSKDVKVLATLFGENTFFGELGKPMQALPIGGQFFSGVEGRSQGFHVDLGEDGSTVLYDIGQ